MDIFRKTIRLSQSVWKLFGSLYAEYRAKMVLLVALAMVSGFAEGLGVTLLIPLFTFFLGDAGGAGSTFTVAFLQNMFSGLGFTLTFQGLLIITISIFLLKAVMLFLFGYVHAKIAANYKTSTRYRLYRGYLYSDFNFLRGQKMGHLEQILIQGVKQSGKLLEYCINFVLSVVTLVTYVVIAFALSPYITVVTLVFGAVFLFVYRPLIRKMRGYSKKLIALGKDIAHVFNENLSGIKTIKTMGREEVVLESARHLFSQIEEAEFRKQITKKFAKLSIEPASVFFIISVFAISYLYLQFNIVAFIAIVYLIHQMFTNVEKIQSGMHVIAETIPGAYDIVGLKNQIEKHKPQKSGTLPFTLERELVFESVSFHYEEKEPLLSGLSFTVPKGGVLGIIGPSGSGKTTIVDLMLRLLNPVRGKILLDGVLSSEVSLKEWRKNVVYVAQDMFMRNATVTENIRFFDPSITESDIIEAAKKAHAYDFIKKLPKGFETVMGERGGRFSGGERQRIALARALSRRPKLLVLDEATSALDNESEALIKEALAGLKGSMAIVIIAHRFSTLLGADRLVAVEKGRVIEQGTPEALLADEQSYFYRLSKLGNVDLS